MGVETLHVKRDGEQVTIKEADGVEFEGPPGGPYEYAGDGSPSREAVRTLQEATDEDVELDVDLQETRAGDKEASDDGGEA